MTVNISKADYQSILTHARTAAPNEACGLIAGFTDGKNKTVKKVYMLTNLDNSAEHFSLDPKEHLAAVKDMRANGFVPLGNFHSHPTTPARPSDEDMRLAYDGSASYLILSLTADEPALKSFYIENGAVNEENLKIIV
jgi:proteasome lid subunit RPN8/RPN11